MTMLIMRMTTTTMMMMRRRTDAQVDADREAGTGRRILLQLQLTMVEAKLLSKIGANMASPTIMLKILSHGLNENV